MEPIPESHKELLELAHSEFRKAKNLSLYFRKDEKLERITNEADYERFLEVNSKKQKRIVFVKSGEEAS